jgi:hypothetical protein
MLALLMEKRLTCETLFDALGCRVYGRLVIRTQSGSANHVEFVGGDRFS